MGFRKEAYATIWFVEPVSDTRTNGRVTISRKNPQTQEYETSFNGFVSFVGTAAAKKASSLKEKDRIRLGDVDVTNKYVKERNVTYTNFNIFSFETQSGIDGAASSEEPKPKTPVDDGEIDDSRLPF